MKFFLVVLLAGLCTTAVTPAPSTTPNFSFQEYELFGDFGSNIKDYLVNLKCITDVVTIVVHGSEFENVWLGTRNQIDHLINVEWKKCLTISDASECIKCKSDVIQRGVGHVFDFSKRLIDNQKLDLLDEIKFNVIRKCLRKKDAPSEMEDEFKDSVVVQFECLVNVLGQVSQSHSLQHLWTKSEPILKNHITKLKQCDNAGHPLLVIFCTVKQSIRTMAVASEYIGLATDQDQTFIEDFFVQYKNNCGGKSDMDVYTFGIEGVEECVRKIGDRLKCISDSIEDSVRKTDYNKIWKEYEQDLVKSQNHLVTCKNKKTTWEAAKCINNELQFSRLVFRRFFDNLKRASDKVCTKVKENIKDRCYA